MPPKHFRANTPTPEESFKEFCLVMGFLIVVGSLLAIIIVMVVKSA